MHGIDEVKQALELLQHHLPVTELAQLKNFNRAYLVITNNVRQQLRKGVFDDPAFISEFDAHFASFYFDAVKSYLDSSGADATPPAWTVALQSSRYGHSSPFILMALGVNAHVNNDIPLVLWKLQVGDKHYKDYMRVNKIIGNSILEVMDGLGKRSRSLWSTRPLVKFVYKPVMKLGISIWRYNAWRKYLRLKNGTMTKHSVEYRAQRNGNFLAKIPL